MFKYKEGENVEEVKLYAVTSPEEDKKHSLAWIAAMQRVREHVGQEKITFRERRKILHNLVHNNALFL